MSVSKKVPRFVQVAGIQSPGLTASPAIGEYVKDLLKKEGCELTEKSDFDPFIEHVPRVRDLGPYEVDELVRKDPLYGNIVCRCEKVSEAEIVARDPAGSYDAGRISSTTPGAVWAAVREAFALTRSSRYSCAKPGWVGTKSRKRGNGSYLLKDRL